MAKHLEKLRYPIGHFKLPEAITDQHLKNWISTIEIFPSRVNEEINHLSDQELENQYRPDGWTIKQVIHHCADSHMNSFIRFKLTLTEDTPTIKPYQEHLWAELSDSKTFPTESSLKILEGIHDRWSALLKNLSGNDLEKKFLHPETNEQIDLKTNIGIYAWHCEHHLAHIINAKRNFPS